MMRLNTKISQLKKNVLSGSFLAVFHTIVMLISYPIYLRILGSALYGLWAAISVILLFAQLGNLGINDAIVKFTADAVGRKDLQGLAEFSTNGLYLLLLPSLVVTLLPAMFCDEIIMILRLPETYWPIGRGLIRVIGLLAAMAIFTSFLMGIVMGIGRVDLANYFSAIGNLLRVIITIILLYTGMGIWALFWGSGISLSIIFLSYLYYLMIKRGLSIFCSHAFDLAKMKSLFVYGGTLISTNLLSILVQALNKVVISRYIGLSAVTFYEIAIRAVMRLRSVFVVGLKALLPEVSRTAASAERSFERILKINLKATKFISVAGVPLFAILFLFGDELLGLWLNVEYDNQIFLCFRVFLLSYLVNLFAVPSYYTFLGLSCPQICFYGAVIELTMNCVLIGSILALSIDVSLFRVTLAHGLSIAISALFLSICFVRMCITPNAPNVRRIS